LKVKVNINVADIRAENKYRSERISQALFNESLEVLEERGGYCRVSGEDAYQGWIDRRFISEFEPSAEGKSWVVTANLAPGYERADLFSRRVASIPYGCILRGEAAEGFLGIDSSRYGIFHVSGEHIRNSKEATAFTQGRLILETEKFLGAPYLWGGRSFFGIDCSGFAQCIMRRFGVRLPRDSKDQRKEGVEVERENVTPGDLLFFPGHVTIAISHSSMIHSSKGNGGVAYNSLDPDSPIYSEYFDKNLQSIRRVLR